MEEAVKFVDSEVHLGDVVMAERFHTMEKLALRMITVADDAFVSLERVKLNGLFAYELRTIRLEPISEPKCGWMKITSPGGTYLGETPLDESMEPTDGSYGLIEYCCEHLGGLLGKQFGETVEQQLLFLLKNGDSPAQFMGFTATYESE